MDTDNDCWFTIKVESQNTVWVLRRSYENARTLDHQLHKCVYDRKFSLLPELQLVPSDSESPHVNTLIIFSWNNENVVQFLLNIKFSYF